MQRFGGSDYIFDNDGLKTEANRSKLVYYF